MKVRIKLLKPFSDIAGRGEVELELEGDIVIQALDRLCKLHPGLRKELFDEKGEISYSVNIFVNDKPLSASEEVSTLLKEGDEILIFMPVSGG